MIKYKTVRKEASAEKIIDKSRFIAHVKPVGSKDEADAFVAAIKAEYRDATHNVPAFVIGDKQELQWASDDGEPSGTSGVPMMQMMAREGLTNLAVVVTRYFGGIKLGPGGLVRAYTSAAKQAIEAAGICQVRELDQLTIRISYAHYNKLQAAVETLESEINNQKFDDAVTATLISEPANTPGLKHALAELTNGSCIFLAEEKVLIKK